MDEALNFFRAYEIWVYLTLGLGALIYFRRFLLSWQDLHSTIFGLERESAQSRLNQAAGVLVLLIIMVVAEFVMVSYLAPMRPQSNPLITPTIDVLATPTTTLNPDLPGEVGEPGPGAGSPTPTADGRIGNCVAGQIEITSPKPGDRISGEVSIEGSADIPNFGFYKLEVALVQEVNWRTIQAGRKDVTFDVLVQNWDTTTLQSGDYVLRLVVTDNSGDALPDCRVPISIVAP